MPAAITDKRAHVFAHVRVDGQTGCWTWTGYIDPKGYGRGLGGSAHRRVYEVLVGPIPPRMTLDHLCRNRACVRPKWAEDPDGHVEPATNKDNVLRGEGACAQNARKTHCKNGHELTGLGVSVRVRKTGQMRTCALCNREWQRRYNNSPKGRERARARQARNSLR